MMKAVEATALIQLSRPGSTTGEIFCATHHPRPSTSHSFVWSRSPWLAASLGHADFDEPFVVYYFKLRDSFSSVLFIGRKTHAGADIAHPTRSNLDRSSPQRQKQLSQYSRTCQ